MAHTIPLAENIRPIMASIKTLPIPPRGAETGAVAPPRVAPFVTISREAGAGGVTLARQLVESLNARDPLGSPWTSWDRELVEKAAEDNHISMRLLESLEQTSHTWLSDFFTGLSLDDRSAAADDIALFRKIAMTIRALAQAGRVVIVGRGGVFLTRQMPGGIHVRLLAPVQHRMANLAREFHLTPEAAMTRMKELDRSRDQFYHRYFPNWSIQPETFTLTINTAAVETSTMVEMITALIRQEARGS